MLCYASRGQSEIARCFTTHVTVCDTTAHIPLMKGTETHQISIRFQK